MILKGWLQTPWRVFRKISHSFETKAKSHLGLRWAITLTYLLRFHSLFRKHKIKDNIQNFTHLLFCFVLFLLSYPWLHTQLAMLTMKLHILQHSTHRQRWAILCYIEQMRDGGGGLSGFSVCVWFLFVRWQRGKKSRQLIALLAFCARHRPLLPRQPTLCTKWTLNQSSVACVPGTSSSRHRYFLE